MNCRDCGQTIPSVFHDCPATPVLEALGRFEEIGGPEGQDYINLMRAIAAEATRRADNCEKNLEAARTLPDETAIEGWFTDIDNPDVREEEFNLSWGEYKQINFDSDELDLIEAALLKGEEFHGGGGAAASYLVRRMQ